MPKIVMLGAGSGFTRPLCTDIMHIPDLEGGEICLVDIDARRLDLAARLIRKVVRIMKQEKKWKIRATTRRREVMKDADYLINSIEVSGVATVTFDHEIPMKYGVKQCIGDTIGPGGIFKALRTVPSWIEILRDAESLCPNALILNYTNPMSIMTLAAVRVTDMPVVGLCHSVQGTSRQLANYAGVPYEEMTWECGGINHMAWFTRLEHGGKDLYPVIRKRIKDPEIYEKDPVRFDTLLHFDYFMSESSGHFSEYVPYYRKRNDLIEKYCRDGYRGGTGFYAYGWPNWRKHGEAHTLKQIRGKAEIPTGRSHEFASQIIAAKEKDQPTVIHGSVLNKGLIENLLPDGVVEVPVLINRSGLNPCRFGSLPPQCAALNISNMVVFDLVVRAILEGKRSYAEQALMLDPLTAAVCSPAEAKKMFGELYRAEKTYVPKLR